MEVDIYNQIVDNYSDNLYRFVLKNIKNKDISQDIVQESFEKLWINRQKVESEKAKSYLFTTAYHLVIDHFRKDKREKILEKTDAKNHHHSISNPDVNEILQAALDKLPLLQKQLVLLRDYEGYSYQEIGEIASISESQVKVYLFRARKALKDYIGSIENVI